MAVGQKRIALPFVLCVGWLGDFSFAGGVALWREFGMWYSPRENQCLGDF